MEHGWEYLLPVALSVLTNAFACAIVSVVTLTMTVVVGVGTGAS